MSDERDVEFINAVYLAEVGSTDELTRLLNSERPLDDVNRRMLAELVNTLVKPPEKKGRKKGSDKLTRGEQWQAVAEFDEMIERGETKQRACYVVSSKWSVSERTLRSFIKQIRDVEEKMRKAGQPNWRFSDWNNLVKN